MIDLANSTLIVLAVILFFGLIVPEFFKRFQLPFATSLIILGSVMGPQGMSYVELDPSMEVFGFLGAAFLMLLAGLDAKGIEFKHHGKTIAVASLLNGLIPFATGLVILKLFDYSWEASIVAGIIFMSSSVSLVLSNVKVAQLEHYRLGKILKGTVLLEDFASLLLLSLMVQYVSPEARFPLPIYLGLLISSVIILRMFLPEVVIYLFRRVEKAEEEYEGHLRVIIVILLAVLLIYSTLDVHPIIAAFLVGFTLTEVPKMDMVKTKLHTIGYGIFVPIFFFIVGTKIDLSILAEFDIKNLLMATLVFGALLSKFISGFIAGKVGKFSNEEATLFSIGTVAKLTTTISATYAALLLNLIDETILTAMVIVSIVSTIFSPALMAVTRKIRKKS